MPISFALNPFGRVCEVIESWKPRGCKTEKDYENSLVKKLEKELVNQKIQRQYGSGRQHKSPTNLSKTGHKKLRRS